MVFVQGPFPICVRPKKLRLTSELFFDAVEFETRCRQLWAELDNGNALIFQIVDQVPTRLPGIKFHIVLTQGDWRGQDWTLLSSQRLPALYRTRAIMYPADCTVNHFSGTLD